MILIVPLVVLITFVVVVVAVAVAVTAGVPRQAVVAPDVVKVAQASLMLHKTTQVIPPSLGFQVIPTLFLLHLLSCGRAHLVIQMHRKHNSQLL